MHSEDYIHRIGRTGRAHAVGDAISFVTPEDQTALRALERFIGRGIVRKRSEEFNYAAAAPAGASNAHHRAAPSNPSRGHANPAKAPSPAAGFSRRHGGHSAPARHHRRWRR
jgi:ATP-dependent RNA helicase RhlE